MYKLCQVTGKRAIRRSAVGWKTYQSINSKQCIATSTASFTKALDTLLPKHDNFAERHIGPNKAQKAEMLKTIGVNVRF